MADQKPIYLDDEGNPIQASAPVYLDDEGNPIGGEAAPEKKSVGGFLSNVASSGGRFFGDIAQAVASPVETAKNLGRLGLGVAEKVIPGRQSHEQYADAAGQFYKDRYGSLSNLGNTLYNDPVGVVGDVSTIAGGGAGALRAAGAVSRSAKPAQIAGRLRAVEHATNPTRLITEPAGRLARATGVGVVRGTVRPPAAVRNDFGGSGAIARTIIDERLRTPARAEAATTAAREAVDARLAAAEAAGVPGVQSGRITSGLRGARDTAAKDVALGAADAGPDVVSRAREIHRQAAGKPIPLTEAQTLKRRAQERAFEAKGQGLTTKAQGEEGIATALRAAIEERVPDVGPMNERTQALLGATRAMEAAADRPKGLTNIASAGAGSALGLSGDPWSALATFLAMQAADSPKFGANAGIFMNDLNKMLRSQILNELALAGRAGNAGQK